MDAATTSKKIRRRLWKPQHGLPWKAVRHGTDDYIWYEVVDRDGWEICTFNAVTPGEEFDDLFREMAFLLVSVNGSNTITVDGKEIQVEWLGENKGVVNGQ